MIRPEDVADLQHGDVVELTFPQEYDSTPIVMRGTYPAVWDFYDNYLGSGNVTLTVVSRAPRPLYTNSDRTEPVPGDVVAAAEPIEIVPGWQPTWVWTSGEKWVGTHTGRPIVGEMCSPLRLLVDGETGQVVP